MAVNLSPVGGVAAQFFDNSGNVLTGGKLYTYLAGTTTPAVTYTTSIGNVAWSNPIILDAAGRVSGSGEVWLIDGTQYKFILRDSNDVLIATYDNITGINSNFISFTSENETQTATQGQTVFTLTTMQYLPATNNLLVFVNGSKQIAGVNYQETSTTVVTFVSGLNVGDEVEFSTAVPIAVNAVDAENVSYNEGDVGAINRSVESKLQESISVADFDSFSSAVTAAAGKALLVESPITVSSTITVPSNVQLIIHNGGIFNIDNAVTLTINGPIQANAYKIFDYTGTGEVKIGPETPIVYAEWWGTANDGSADDALAIQAACDALSPAGGIVQLLNKYYYLQTLITVTTQSLTIQGTTLGLSPYDYGSGGPWGTQLIGTNGVNGIRVFNVGYFTLKNVELYLPLGATSACIGVLLDSCFLAKVDDCRINNYSTAIKLIVCTNTFIFRCYLASKDTTFATIIGIDIDGTTTQNQSILIQQCIVAHTNYTATAYGYYLHGDRINDTFVDTCEASFCTSGFYINGSTVDTGYGADIHFRGCVADGCVVGFDVNSLAVDSACEIVNGWSACSSIGIFVGYSSARVLISGMQLYGATNSIVVQDSSQMIVTNNFCLYPSTNAILLNNCPATVIANNQGFQKTAAAANFISLTNNSTYCSISSNIANSSIAGGWGYGIIATTGCDFLSVVGNSMPLGGAITIPYTLNLPTNSNTYFAGTGTPN